MAGKVDGQERGEMYGFSVCLAVVNLIADSIGYPPRKGKLFDWINRAYR